MLSMIRSLAAATYLGIVVFASSAAAQEWTRFRGPNGQGQYDSADTIPIEWTEADYNWKVELPGVGNSSPVIWQDHVYVVSGDPKTGTRYVSCLSSANGDTLWKREYPAGPHHVHKFNTFASSTPAVDDRHVYIAWATPEEIALLALTHAGDQAWKKNLGTFKSEHGFGTSPIVVDEMVILSNDQEGEDRFIVALDAGDGEERWKIPRKYANNRQNLSYATPCVRETAGGRELIVCSWAHGISSHDLQTGAVNWEMPVFKLRPVGSPVLVGELIFGNCGEGSGNNTVVAIKPSDRKGETPEIVYSKDRSIAPYVPTLCAAGDLIFLWGDKGIVSCLDAASGSTYWTQRVGGNFFGSPVRAGNRIYCMSTDGDVVVIEAATKYKLLARNSLGEGTRATPALADGRMYLRTDSHLISLGGEAKQQTAATK